MWLLNFTVKKRRKSYCNLSFIFRRVLFNSLSGTLFPFSRKLPWKKERKTCSRNVKEKRESGCLVHRSKRTLRQEKRRQGPVDGPLLKPKKFSIILSTQESLPSGIRLLEGRKTLLFGVIIWSFIFGWPNSERGTGESNTFMNSTIKRYRDPSGYWVVWKRICIYYINRTPRRKTFKSWL